MAGDRLPIATEGWPFVLVPLVPGVALWLAGRRGASAPLLGLAGCMAWFFRDPERLAPAVPGGILAPADGRVVDVRRLEDPFVGSAQRVAIFLSPLDVHINRAPLSGVVADVEHSSGGYRAAFDVAGSEGNERTRIAIQGETGRVVVRQVAGLLARRIVCRARPGDRLVAGERFGMIKFGSRTDVVVPESARLSVRVGDRVRGGETIVGVLA